MEADNVPYTLSLCDGQGSSGRISEGASECGEGFTFIVPATGLRELSSMAPSEYQSNWRRSSGVTEGGPAIEILLNDVFQALLGLNESEIQALVNALQAFHVGGKATGFLPPVPIDFVSSLGIHAGHDHLPFFAGPLAERPLAHWTGYPVWQIYYSQWSIGASASSVIRELAQRLSRSQTSNSGVGVPDQISGLRVTRLADDPFPRLEFYPNNSTQPRVEVVLKRSVRLEGMKFQLQTSIELEHPETFSGCELILEQLLPPEVFVDEYEVRAHLAPGSPVYSFPSFHDIELPAHLAAPQYIQTRYFMEPQERVYSDSQSFHLRYQIQNGEETSVDVLVNAPSVHIRCDQRKTAVTFRSCLAHEGCNLRLEAPVVSTRALPLVTLVTAIALLTGFTRLLRLGLEALWPEPQRKVR